MENFYFTYVLLSQKDGKYYTGFSSNLPLRFESHNQGKVPSTKNRRPFKLIYYEACINKQDALKREKYLAYRQAGLKTQYVKLYLAKRLKSYLSCRSNIAPYHDFTSLKEKL